jgi:large subunit ribosomal protein L6
MNSFFFKVLLPQYVYIHLKGIGFKLYKSSTSNSLIVNSGYNHYTKFTPLFRPDVSFLVRKSYVLIFSYAKSISNFSNIIRKIRFPDPYRGKGFRFKNQILKFKIGKQR